MSSQPDGRTYRGAVIGAGYFSQFHYDAWKRMPDVEIVSCCDVDMEKANDVAQTHGVKSVYSDYRQMLDQHQVDFVDIITRPDTHLELVDEISQRGIAIICQKPLAPTVQEAREMVSLVEERGIRFMVHENFRFQPWYREMKRLMEDGVIGNRLHSLSFRNRAGDGHGPEAYLARQPYFQTMEKFLIFEAGIHTIDTFRYLGGEIEQTWCWHRKLNPVIAGEDTAVGVFRFEGGAMGLYDANRFNESTSKNPRYTFGEVLLEGDGGSIRLYDDGRLTIQGLGESEREHVYSLSQHGFAGDCVFATQRNFIDNLSTGEAFETDGPNYLKSLAVQEAMYASSESGCWESPRV
ncbi:oxidoreductase, Gfo/Idh/MocA family [Rhodopirellula baltica SH28]|uniref:Oxidoreductase, Gfo/Idh/MocA family n=1 Tax=Rhodopirellula baltica SH28 TaxID=993517 RepID=K5D9L5_RHOBT|nr:Gfo/Idh/MocA family oxidoreductase [Rhodopirellula baltica]EKJ99493.1 oxidoreductase, Gfo/Idh/MocA family [Rhodopirellula baltica SH28]